MDPSQRDTSAMEIPLNEGGIPIPVADIKQEVMEFDQYNQVEAPNGNEDSKPAFIPEKIEIEIDIKPDPDELAVKYIGNTIIKKVRVEKPSETETDILRSSPVAPYHDSGSEHIPEPRSRSSPEDSPDVLGESSNLEAEPTASTKTTGKRIRKESTRIKNARKSKRAKGEAYTNTKPRSRSSSEDSPDVLGESSNLEATASSKTTGKVRRESTRIKNARKSKRAKGEAYTNTKPRSRSSSEDSPDSVGESSNLEAEPTASSKTTGKRMRKESTWIKNVRKNKRAKDVKEEVKEVNRQPQASQNSTPKTKPEKVQIKIQPGEYDASEIKYVRTKDSSGEIGGASTSQDENGKKNNIIKKRRPPKERTHRCEVCEHMCQSASALIIHMRKHTGEKPYKCDTCDFRCTGVSNLNKHMRKHTGEKPYKCDKCDVRCSELGNLKKHARTHLGPMPYKCHVCQSECPSMSALSSHMMTHTGEKPFKCEVCEYRCSRNVDLRVHMRVHTGEKPYKCDYCDYQCAAGSGLTKHMRTHTGEKPYKCDVCNHQFIASNSLKTHMRTHTGEKPFKCELCHHQFAVANALKNHMRTHTGETPYKCDSCDYQCRWYSTLRAHVKKHAEETQ